MKKLRSRLWIKLILSAVFAAACAAFVYVWALELSYRLLDQIYINPAVILKREEQYIKDFQSYVTEQKLSMNDRKKIKEFTKTDWTIVMALYQENDIIFSSDSRFIVPLPADEYGETIKDTSEASGVFNVTFTDGAVQAALVYTGYENYQSAGVIVTLLSGLCFAVILYLLIRKKVKYIELLGKELEILKGGDLNYQITIRGNDELAALAGEMDSMRRAIRSRQEEEELAHLANRGIVTAMSHDLRTPLTALMGYLDILSIEEDPGKKQKYLSVCRDKACQIKSLSDKLFEYFLVYSSDQDELHADEVNGAEFVGQIVEESLFDLENEGIEVARRAGEITCRLLVDVDLMRRVFGNLFSNILKYADRSHAVQAEYGETKGELVIRLRNSVAADASERESSNIGLKTCETILKRHGGTFSYQKDAGMFEAEVRIPCIRE